MGKPNYYPNPNDNPYKVRRENPEVPTPTRSTKVNIDFNTQRICPSCGKLIKINHNFCKFCGVDLSSIEPIGMGDEVSKQLAITAISDPAADVRKDAVDTLGEFEEIKVLGVLTYVLLNDIDENVRKKAAEELGTLAHPISLDILAKALKDRSPIVRKEAIEGLKNIKKKNKPIPQPEKEQEISYEAEPEKREISEEETEAVDENEDEPKLLQEVNQTDDEDFYKL
ncbi:MAG: HEAT repeat domain-containing protein [Promethearchaeota archaeon]